MPAQYAGSLLELDFGEAGEEKRVVVVDVEPGLPAAVRSVPLGRGRRLLRPRGPWDEILGMDGVHDSYLDLTVETAGPDPGLAERAFDEFDYLVKVRPDYPRVEAPRPATEYRSLTEQYSDYYSATYETETPEDLIEAFTSVLEEVVGASG